MVGGDLDCRVSACCLEFARRGRTCLLETKGQMRSRYALLKTKLWCWERNKGGKGVVVNVVVVVV